MAPDVRHGEPGADLRRWPRPSWSRSCRRCRGVGQVIVGGGALPAVRVEVNPTELNAKGLSLEDVRAALASANANNPKGAVGDMRRNWSISTTDQLLKAVEYQPQIVAYNRTTGAAVRLSDIASVIDSVEDIRTGGLTNGKPAVIDHHLPPARRQHHRHRRPRACGAAATAGVRAAGHLARRPDRPPRAPSALRSRTSNGRSPSRSSW